MIHLSLSSCSVLYPLRLFPWLASTPNYRPTSRIVPRLCSVIYARIPYIVYSWSSWLDGMY